MRNRNVVIFLLFLALLMVLTYAAGFTTHWVLSDRGRLVKLPRPAPAAAVVDEREQFGLFWESWEIVKKDFYGELPQGSQFTYSAIRGVLDALDDPYTVFVEPSPRELERDALRGSFGGIGAWVMQREDGAVVLTPMPDRPADRAGIQEGDVVVAVDDVDVRGMARDDVVVLIRGPVGQAVGITVLREATGEELTFSVQREVIETPTVEWRILEQAPDVGYIRIGLLGQRTNDEFQDAIRDLRAQGAQRLVLDLRGNPGGILDAAVQIASQFLNDGTVLYERRKDGTQRAYPVRSGGVARDLETIVLVNGGTASGAEIIAGALQAAKRAAVVGERTFGKGSVQNVYDMADGSSLHVTVAKWFTPDQRLIDGNGLDPDEVVPFSPEDRAANLDPQLDRALQRLRGGAQAQTQALVIRILG